MERKVYDQSQSHFGFGHVIKAGVGDPIIGFHKSRSSSFVPVPKKSDPYANPGNVSSIQSAVKSYSNIFNDSLKYWIENELKLFQKPDKLLEIPNVSLFNILEKLRGLPPATLTEINVKLEQTVSSHVAFLLLLKNDIQTISETFINELKELNWLNDNEVDMNTILEQFCRNEDEAFTDVKYMWLKLATESLTNQYSQFKKVITQREMSNARKVVIQLIETFKSTFNILLDNHAPFDQEHLFKIYKSFELKFTNAFHNSLSYKQRDSAFSSKYEAMLRKKLEDEFCIFKSKNQVKCKKAQGQISKIIDKLRMHYSAALDSYLDDNQDGSEESKLVEYNRQLQNQLLETLRNQVGTEVGPDEPIDVHWTNLSHHIKDYFSYVQKENRERLRKASSPKFEKETSKKIPSLEESCEELTTDKEVYPHPLLFRLTMQNLLCCTLFKDKLHFFSGHPGKHDVPMTVALNNEGLFTFGLYEKKKESFHRIWFLEKCFIAGNDEQQPWSELVTIHGQSFVIRFEFLLGFLLMKLKNVAEKQLSARFLETVITVPSWFGSTHKIQIKDAAVVGGFSGIYLVNELSAVAFSHVHQILNEKSSKPDTFVVVEENNNFIHAAVYTYDQEHNLVLMLGDCMNYCHEGGKDVRNTCQSAVNLAYTNSFELSISLEKSIKTFLLLSNSEKGKQLLKSVTNSSYDLDATNAIMTGAALLGMNPKEIGLRVRDQIASEILMQSSSTPKTVSKVVIKKEIGLPAESETRLLKSLQNTRDIFFWQIVGPSRVNVPIGKLSVTASSPSKIPAEIQPIFVINREGIMKLAFVKVFFETHSRNIKESKVYNVSAKCIEWITQNVPISLRDELSAMLKNLENVEMSKK